MHHVKCKHAMTKVSAVRARAAKAALENGKPWVLDPVAAGATPYRTQACCLLALSAHLQTAC